MVNSSLSLSSLDFDTLKQNFKNFLVSNSVFKDYNFNGSNINVLMDLLSYNSYLNSFYLNMTFAEMFLDSAQKYDSIASHSKELNYVPRSAKSSSATINFIANTTGVVGTFDIPEGTLFEGINSNGSFVFITDEQRSFVSSNSQFVVANLDIHEGRSITDTFVINYTQETQLFTLSNPNIDTDSLRIKVIEDNGQTNTLFQRASTLFNLDGTSNVFFIQASHNNQYDIVFGDGIFGRIPQNFSIVQANYRVSSGPSADGISRFTCMQDLGIPNNGAVTLSTITIGDSGYSDGGAVQESIEEVRFNAPRYYATQQRAVASDDYGALVKENFGSYIEDTSTYGGELLEPKQYGRVVIALKPLGGTIVPNYIKDEIAAFLKSYASVPTRVILTDPNVFYCAVTSTINYDNTITQLTPADIQSMVYQTILNFSQTNLERFDRDFRYSKFVTAIDDTDLSITSNNTEVKLVKRIAPVVNVENSFIIDFGNSAEFETPFNEPPTMAQVLAGELALFSSHMVYVDADGNSYPESHIVDDGNGRLNVLTHSLSIPTIVNDNIGTIDYATGIVRVNKLVVASYLNTISFYFKPSDKDIIVTQDKLLIIDSNGYGDDIGQDIQITVNRNTPITIVT